MHRFLDSLLSTTTKNNKSSHISLRFQWFAQVHRDAKWNNNSSKAKEQHQECSGLCANPPSRAFAEIWHAAIPDEHDGFWWVLWSLHNTFRHSQSGRVLLKVYSLLTRECLQIVLLIYKACFIFKSPTFSISICSMSVFCTWPKIFVCQNRCQQDFWNRWMVMGECHNKA